VIYSIQLHGQPGNHRLHTLQGFKSSISAGGVWLTLGCSLSLKSDTNIPGRRTIGEFDDIAPQTTPCVSLTLPEVGNEILPGLL